MKILVLGSGCPNCKKLFEQTKQAVTDLKMDATVEYSDDIQKLLELGAMGAPVLAIDNKIALSGQVPGVERIKEILTNCKEIKSEKAGGGYSCGCC